MKLLRRLIFSLATLTLVIWVGDYLALTQWDTVRVDQVYITRNKFNQVEHARGGPIMETCGYSLLPHDGKRPCWYVKRHTLNNNHLE